jgi:hypothetical protein
MTRRRVVQFPEALKRQAEVVVGFGIIRFDGDRPGHEIGGDKVFPRLQGDHAEQMQGHRLPGVGPQDLLVDALGLGQAARLVVLARVINGLLKR